jgi:site-specific DNA-methyltransferase (adenine-specific)
MKIETLQIKDLTPDPSNARQHDEKNLKAIQGSLNEFGQRKPIVITEAGVIVAGNGTVEAAKRLGWLEIQAVRVPGDWTPEQTKAFALADNRTAELAAWNTETLTAQLQELEEEGWEIADFGFEALDFPGEDKPIIEDEVPESAPSRVSFGDLWKLGNHKLFCADSLNENNLKILMAEEPLQTIVSDPPYGMSFVSNHRAIKHKAIENDNDAKALEYVCGLDAQHSKYLFCRWDNLVEVPKPTSLITWVKNNWSMGDLEHSHARQTEVILFYPGKEHEFPSGRPSDVVKYSRTGNNLHPTQKPVELMAEVCSWTKGIIVDPFAGSGSTLIAAQQLGRTCYGMELDPKYCDVIIQRWETLTGQKAELLDSKTL